MILVHITVWDALAFKALRELTPNQPLGHGTCPSLHFTGLAVPQTQHTCPTFRTLALTVLSAQMCFFKPFLGTPQGVAIHAAVIINGTPTPWPNFRLQCERCPQELGGTAALCK